MWVTNTLEEAKSRGALPRNRASVFANLAADREKTLTRISSIEVFDRRHVLSFSVICFERARAKDFLDPRIRVPGSRCLPRDQSVGSYVAIYGFSFAHVSALS